MTDSYFKNNQFKLKSNQQKNNETYSNLINKSQFSFNGFRQSQFDVQNPNYMCINQDQYQNNIFNNNYNTNDSNDSNMESFSKQSISIENRNNSSSNESFVNNINKSQLIQSSLVTSSNDTNEFERKCRLGNLKILNIKF